MRRRGNETRQSNPLAWIPALVSVILAFTFTFLVFPKVDDPTKITYGFAEIILLFFIFYVWETIIRQRQLKRTEENLDKIYYSLPSRPVLSYDDSEGEHYNEVIKLLHKAQINHERVRATHFSSEVPISKRDDPGARYFEELGKLIKHRKHPLEFNRIVMIGSKPKLDWTKEWLEEFKDCSNFDVRHYLRPPQGKEEGEKLIRQLEWLIIGDNNLFLHFGRYKTKRITDKIVIRAFCDYFNELFGNGAELYKQTEKRQREVNHGQINKIEKYIKELSRKSSG